MPLISDRERRLLESMQVFADGVVEALTNFREALNLVAEWGVELPPPLAGEIRDQVDEWLKNTHRLRSELMMRSAETPGRAM